MIGKAEGELCVGTYMKRKPDVGEERKKLVSLDNKEEMFGGHEALGRKRKSIEIPSLGICLCETMFHSKMGEKHGADIRKQCNVGRTFQNVQMSLLHEHLRWREKSLSYGPGLNDCLVL